MIRIIYFGLVTVLVLVTGCASIDPMVRDINIVSISQEKEISTKMASGLTQEMPPVQDPAALERVRSIGNRLVTALPKKDFDYEFGIVSDKTPNAFTIPGGKIYVHAGLLSFVASDDELAGVLAHEIAHAYERHPAKNLTRLYGVDFLSQQLIKNDPNIFQKLALDIAKGGVLSRYSRADETEADEIGFLLLKRAGYSPNGLVDFLKKLEGLSGDKTLLSFFSTHPSTSGRVAHLEALSEGKETVKVQGF